MNAYDFTVRLDRTPTDAEEDALYEAGLDDGNLETSPDGRAWMVVTREADSLDDAILSVVANIRAAGLTAVGIANEDLVNLATIARRTGRTRESVRLLAAGKRGPGGFPAPAFEGFYSWAQVRRWFADYEGANPAYGTEDDTLALADLFLRARLLRADPGRLAELMAA